MNLFISWSGEKSYAVAEKLRSWIPKVIQAIKPFLSKKDTNKGKQWRDEISKKLEDTHAGIFCLTNDNLDSPWLHFEAGAISKVQSGGAYVCTYLLDITPTDVKEPLAQFQHTLANKEETKSLIKTLNHALKEKNLPGSLDEKILDDVFETFWPELKDSLERILSSYKTGEPETPERSERELLEEILSLVREMSKQTYISYQHPWEGQYTFTGTPPVSATDYNVDLNKFSEIISKYQNIEARKRALDLLLGIMEIDKKASSDEE